MLENQIQCDLLKINIPPVEWLFRLPEIEDVLDVAIIGGGMVGMSAAFALRKEGITRVKIFDKNASNEEGPWTTYARMLVLRSNKKDLGPSLGIPSLTFWSWYEAQYGKKKWDELCVIPTKQWHAYLCWFRQVLNLPVENEMSLIKIQPHENVLELTFNHKGSFITLFARKVILATGRDGAGGNVIPSYLKSISKRLYAHSGEIIEPDFFCDKRIAIIGSGASAFDAAATALENGAVAVEMLIRRPKIVSINKFSQFFFSGIENGFYFLSDEMRWAFFAEALKSGTPPPRAAIERVKSYDQFHLHYNNYIESLKEIEGKVALQTNKKCLEVDFVVAATGYEVDLAKRFELSAIQDSILLWKDRIAMQTLDSHPMLGFFPYLGPSFEFLEKNIGEAPYLKNIYCFNYGAALSHGLLSSDIAGISAGATRLAKGIAADFFVSASLHYFRALKSNG